MKIIIFRFNYFQENTYVIYDQTNECVVVDPGMYSQKEEEYFVKTITKEGLKPVAIINTHCHSDHILGVKFLKDTYNIPFYAHPDDKFLLENAAECAKMWDWQIKTPISIDIETYDNQTIKFGNSQLKTIHTPGHTPGQQAIVGDSDKFLIVGDTIFKGSVGRTDLPGGNLDKMMISIKDKILSYPEEYTIFPGHGSETTIGIEKKQNPFLLD